MNNRSNWKQQLGRSVSQAAFIFAAIYFSIWWITGTNLKNDQELAEKRDLSGMVDKVLGEVRTNLTLCELSPTKFRLRPVSVGLIKTLSPRIIGIFGKAIDQEVKDAVALNPSKCDKTSEEYKRDRVLTILASRNLMYRTYESYLKTTDYTKETEEYRKQI